MKKINLMNIENNLEEVVMMKQDVESLNDNEEKMTLNEFFDTMKVYSTIFVHKGMIIPFSMINGKNDTYFIYCASTSNGISFVGKDIEKKTNEAVEALQAKLSSIDYNLSKLSKKNIFEMSQLSEDLVNSAVYFIIDNDYYV